MVQLSRRSERQPQALGPLAPPELEARPGQDAADVHVRRWQGWADVPFNADVEETVSRLYRLAGYLMRTTRDAVGQVGLKPHDYETLHVLMIRETPGYATISELAASAGVSNATMTGRIDRLEKLGFVRRAPSEDDRRVIFVQAEKSGFHVWRRAMALRAEAEEALFADLSHEQLRALADQLRYVTLALERRE